MSNKPTTRAKFYVTEKSETIFHTTGERQTVIKMRPVTSGSDENKQFYKYTPSGNLDLGVVSPALAVSFHLGEEYYVDFTPATNQEDVTTATSLDSGSSGA